MLNEEILAKLQEDYEYYHQVEFDATGLSPFWKSMIYVFLLNLLGALLAIIGVLS